MTTTLRTGIGETLAVALRIYLTGDLCLTAGNRLVRGERLPRRQGRLAFAYLVIERSRPVERDELAELLWPDRLPAAHEVGVSALISKLRTLLVDVGLERGALTAVSGCYRIELPPAAWVDTDAALEAVHAAEAALRAGSYSETYGPAVVASCILRRPFLPGAEGAWVEAKREALRIARLRALDCLAEVHAWNGEPSLALRAAEEAVGLEPYREVGYRRLMRIHQQAGNRAEAIRVYERLRRLLDVELGASPAAETVALLAEIARA